MLCSYSILVDNLSINLVNELEILEWRYASIVSRDAGQATGGPSQSILDTVLTDDSYPCGAAAQVIL